MARLLRIEEVKRRTGLSRTSIWRRERNGDFPARRRIGPNSVAWIEEEVEGWIESRPTVEAGAGDVAAS